MPKVVKVQDVQNPFVFSEEDYKKNLKMAEDLIEKYKTQYFPQITLYLSNHAKLTKSMLWINLSPGFRFPMGNFSHPLRLDQKHSTFREALIDLWKNTMELLAQYKSIKLKMDNEKAMDEKMKLEKEKKRADALREVEAKMLNREVLNF